MIDPTHVYWEMPEGLDRADEVKRAQRAESRRALLRNRRLYA